jgi:hypothetical protein
MTPLIFSEKRTLVSDFSPAEMLLIARTQSAALARKYFLTKYAVPVVLTAWYQMEESDRAVHRNICCVRLLPTPRGLHPHLSFEQVSGRSVADGVLSMAAFNETHAAVFRACPPNLWAGPEASLDAALMAAFEECLPERWSVTDSDTLDRVPLIASIQRTQNPQGGESVTLNVLVKTRNNVRNEEFLLNQAEHKEHPQLVRSSKKYQKMYNVLTGKWIGICYRDDPDMCDKCRVIFASPAAENAYSDPDFS